MTESTPKAKRARKANWQPRETEMLVEFVSANSDILNASFNATVTNKQKLTLWDTITDRLNSSGSVRRDSDEVKKKWADLKSQSRKKAANVRQQSMLTGGGPPPPSLSDLDLKIVSTIPKCQIEGCVGGIESEASSIIDCVPAVDIVLTSEEAATPLISEADLAVEQESSLPDECKEQNAFPSASTSALSHKRKVIKSSYKPQVSMGDSLLEIEREKLDLMKQMLSIMKRRLEIEEERMRQTDTSMSMSLSPIIKF